MNSSTRLTSRVVQMRSSRTWRGELHPVDGVEGRKEMRMRTLRTLLAVLVITAAPVAAQSGLAGKWDGEEKSANGVVPIVLQLTVKGSAASGSLTVGQNPSTAVSDGKITGNKVSFKTSMFMNGAEVPVHWEGELKNSKLTLMRSVGTSTKKMLPLTLERSK
jgi:hypothetical protein